MAMLIAAHKPSGRPSVGLVHRIFCLCVTPYPTLIKGTRGMTRRAPSHAAHITRTCLVCNHKPLRQRHNFCQVLPSVWQAVHKEGYIYSKSEPCMSL